MLEYLVKRKNRKNKEIGALKAFLRENGSHYLTSRDATSNLHKSNGETMFPRNRTNFLYHSGNCTLSANVSRTFESPRLKKIKQD